MPSKEQLSVLERNGWVKKFPEESILNLSKIQLAEDVIAEEGRYTRFPQESDIYIPFLNVKVDDVKVVIVGQDPYPSDLACGPAFATRYKPVPLPSSLVNIFKELKRTIGTPVPECDLMSWQKQGVLLLNSSWSYRGKDLYDGLIWRPVMEQILRDLDRKKRKAVFVFVGRKAQTFRKLIVQNLRLDVGHPSGANSNPKTSFVGSNIFVKVNKYLGEKKAIEW